MVKIPKQYQDLIPPYSALEGRLAPPMKAERLYKKPLIDKAGAAVTLDTRLDEIDFSTYPISLSALTRWKDKIILIRGIRTVQDLFENIVDCIDPGPVNTGPERFFSAPYGKYHDIANTAGLRSKSLEVTYLVAEHVLRNVDFKDLLSPQQTEPKNEPENGPWGSFVKNGKPAAKAKAR